jgi:hypothetical protein
MVETKAVIFSLILVTQAMLAGPANLNYVPPKNGNTRFTNIRSKPTSILGGRACDGGRDKWTNSSGVTCRNRHDRHPPRHAALAARDVFLWKKYHRCFSAEF